MNERKFKHIYGPVFSWRLGRSLGIDLVGTGSKHCNFDCIYCQVGKLEGYAGERKEFVPTDAVIGELLALPEVRVDYVTFSGMGEPTLAENLGKVIEETKKIRSEKVAVLTNSALAGEARVRDDLRRADFVVMKLDAVSRDSLKRINRPAEGIEFESIVEGIKSFRNGFDGRLGLQIMFVEENAGDAARLAEIAKEIAPDEVQINTPLRPCPVRALSKEEIDGLTGHFQGLNVISVYSVETKKVLAFDEHETFRRRGKPGGGELDTG